MHIESNGRQATDTATIHPQQTQCLPAWRWCIYNLAAAVRRLGNRRQRRSTDRGICQCSVRARFIRQLIGLCIFSRRCCSPCCRCHFFVNIHAHIVWLRHQLIVFINIILHRIELRWQTLNVPIENGSQRAAHTTVHLTPWPHHRANAQKELINSHSTHYRSLAV